MIDVTEIVLNSGRDIGLTMSGEDQNKAFAIASRACIATLRAVAARCAELALHNYDNMEGCATAEEIDKWSTCMGMASDLMDELISQAAAIEKGGEREQGQGH